MLRSQFAVERRVPAWLRPAFRGAAAILVLGRGVLGKLYALAVIATLMLLVGPGLAAVVFLGLVGLLMAAGAVGGAVHALLEPLDAWGRIGAWLRGFPAILGAIITMILLTPRGPFSLYDTQLYPFIVIVTALGAGVLPWLEERRPGRLTARQFAWIQTHPRPEAESGRPRRGPSQRQGWLALRDALVVRLRGARHVVRRV